MANVVALYWFSSSADHRRDLVSIAKNTDYSKSAILGLELLNERPAEKPVRGMELEVLGESVAEMAGVVADVDEVAADNTFCQLLGPFSTEDELTQFRAGLSDHGVQNNLLKREEVVREDFWLIIPPRKTRWQAEQLLHELEQKQIESFIVDGGEYQNAISLGIFVEQKNTGNYREKLAKLGVEAEVVLRPHFKKMTWVQVSEGIENRQAMDWIEEQFAGLSDGIQRLGGQPCVSEDSQSKK
ncbi:hypothetical protein [Porticoccus sp.]